MMNSFSEYVKSTKAELKHVSWPTKKQTIAFTTAVIMISVAVSFYLAMFDAVFMEILRKTIFG